MAPGPKTTWEDFSNLGLYRKQVFDKLNAARDNTMHDLTEKFCVGFGWYAYNTLKGTPRSNGDQINTVHQDDTVWFYDNTQDTKPFETNVEESWTESSTASLSVTIKAGIELKQSITIPEVGGSDFSISISTESTEAKTEHDSHSLTNKWKITVEPGEKVSLQRTKTTTKGQTIYFVDYGVTDNSDIGTHGDWWNGHKYWAFNINGQFGSPTGTMRLMGTSVKETYSFKIIREKASGGKAVTLLDQPKEKIDHFAALLEKNKIDGYSTRKPGLQ